MEGYRHAESESRQRTNPKFWDPRWYYLKALKKAIENTAKSVTDKDPVLLDYGCGSMPYREIFAPRLGKYIGADLADNLAADVLVSEKGEIMAASETYDIVLSTQVLEHVPDPHFYLQECYRVLKPNGKLILTTHGYWMYHPDPTDFWRWTSSGLSKIVEDAGLHIHHFEGIIGRAAMGLQLFQDGIMFKLPALIRPIVVVPLQLLILFFDKIEKQRNKAKDACTFLLIAKK